MSTALLCTALITTAALQPTSQLTDRWEPLDGAISPDGYSYVMFAGAPAFNEFIVVVYRISETGLTEALGYAETPSSVSSTRSLQFYEDGTQYLVLNTVDGAYIARLDDPSADLNFQMVLTCASEYSTVVAGYLLCFDTEGFVSLYDFNASSLQGVFQADLASDLAFISHHVVYEDVVFITDFDSVEAVNLTDATITSYADSFNLDSCTFKGGFAYCHEDGIVYVFHLANKTRSSSFSFLLDEEDPQIERVFSFDADRVCVLAVSLSGEIYGPTCIDLRWLPQTFGLANPGLMPPASVMSMIRFVNQTAGYVIRPHPDGTVADFAYFLLPFSIPFQPAINGRQPVINFPTSPSFPVGSFSKGSYAYVVYGADFSPFLHILVYDIDGGSTRTALGMFEITDSNLQCFVAVHEETNHVVVSTNTAVYVADLAEAPFLRFYAVEVDCKMPIVAGAFLFCYVDGALARFALNATARTAARDEGFGVQGTFTYQSAHVYDGHTFIALQAPDFTCNILTVDAAGSHSLVATGLSYPEQGLTFQPQWGSTGTVVFAPVGSSVFVYHYVTGASSVSSGSVANFHAVSVLDNRTVAFVGTDKFGSVTMDVWDVAALPATVSSRPFWEVTVSEGPAFAVFFAEPTRAFTAAPRFGGVESQDHLELGEVSFVSLATTAPDTLAPPTLAPATIAPDTSAPSVAPATVAPDTSVPTVAPATTAPDTSAPSVAPATTAPDTSAPSAAPATIAPDTSVPSVAPATIVPDTSAPSVAPATIAPDTSAPSVAPATTAPDTSAPSLAPATTAPDTSAPSVAPATTAPDTSAPSLAPATTAPDTSAPSVAPATTAPDTSAPSLAPATIAPDTSAPTAAPATAVPDTLPPADPPTPAPEVQPTQVPILLPEESAAPDVVQQPTPVPAQAPAVAAGFSVSASGVIVKQAVLSAPFAAGFALVLRGRAGEVSGAAAAAASFLPELSLVVAKTGVVLETLVLSARNQSGESLVFTHLFPVAGSYVYITTATQLLVVSVTVTVDVERRTRVFAMSQVPADNLKQLDGVGGVGYALGNSDGMNYLILWADAGTSEFAASVVHLLNVGTPRSPGLVGSPVELPVGAAKSVAAAEDVVCLLSGDVLWVLSLAGGVAAREASVQIAARGNAVSLFSAPWAERGALVASEAGLVVVNLASRAAHYFVVTNGDGSVTLPDRPSNHQSPDWLAAIAAHNGTVIRKTGPASIPFAYEYAALSVKPVPSAGLVSEASTEIMAYRGVSQPLIAVIRLDFQSEKAVAADVTRLLLMDAPTTARGESLDLSVFDTASDLRLTVFSNGSLVEGFGASSTLASFAFVRSEAASYVAAATGGVTVVNTTDPNALRTTNGTLSFPDAPTDLVISSPDTDAAVLWVASLSGIYAFSVANPFEPRSLAPVATDPVSPFVCSSLALLSEGSAGCVTEQPSAAGGPPPDGLRRCARSLAVADDDEDGVDRFLWLLNVSDPRSVAAQSNAPVALGAGPIELVASSTGVLEGAKVVSDAARALLEPQVSWTPCARCAFIVQGSSVKIVNTTAGNDLVVVGEAANLCSGGGISALDVLEGSLIIAACGERGVAVAQVKYDGSGRFLSVSRSASFVQADFSCFAVATSLSEGGDVLTVAGGDSIVVALQVGPGATFTKVNQVDLTTNAPVGSLPAPIGQVVDLSVGTTSSDGFALSENHFVSYNLTTQPPVAAPSDTPSSEPSLALAIPIIVVGTCICLLLLAYAGHSAYKTRQITRRDRFEEAKTVNTSTGEDCEPHLDPSCPLAMEGTLCGGWSVLRELGRGSYGAVYLGLTEERELIALKIAHVSQISDLDGLSREVDIMAALQHPNVICYIGSERVLDRFVILMEYIEGGSLASFAKRAELSEVVASGYISQVCSGVAYIHSKRVLHRDIKGENVLVAKDGRAVLADFGCSKLMTVGASSGSSTFIGTPCWMAPEVITCGPQGEYKTSADIWSLGITIIEVLNSGQAPWPALPTMYAVMQHISTNHLPTIPAHVSPLCRDLLQQVFVEDSKRPTAAQLLQHPWFQLANGREE
ncbi:Mitogen-activated protein kinase kinase kinase A [Diplonema papillatum]|nr:Mitogen-activated protein kinase kinase kinase A [Diplonema papillatum]